MATETFRIVSQSLLRLLAHQSAALWIGCAVMGFALPGFACSVRFLEQAGFVHADAGHLPSNARGVLFLGSTSGNWFRGTAGPTAIIVSAVPSPLSSQNFVITETGSSTPLKVVIERVNLEMADDVDESKHYYLLVKPIQKKADAYIGDIDPERLPQLLAQGKLKQVDESFKKGFGLFRVAPASGFQAGKTYSIRRTDSQRHQGGWAYPDQMTVTIDGPFDLASGHRFAIQAAGLPKITPLSLPAGGSCSSTHPSTVQYIDFVVPAAFNAYRNFLGYSTFERPHRSPLGYLTPSGQFVQNHYDSSVGSRSPFGQSELGPGKDLVFRMCDNVKKPNETSEVKGTVSFLEMADTAVYETPVIRVDFGQAKGRSCDGFELFRQALASGDNAEIRERVCKLWPGEGEPTDLLPPLINLAASPDGDTKRCALLDLPRVTRISRNLDAPNLRKLIALLATVLSDRDPKTVATAKIVLIDLLQDVQRRIVEDLQRRPAERRANGLSLSLFAPVAGIMAEAMINGSSSYRATLANALMVMGPTAKDAVPVLMPKLDSSGRADSVLDVLQMIAPDDPRVIEAARQRELRTR